MEEIEISKIHMQQNKEISHVKAQAEERAITCFEWRVEISVSIYNDAETHDYLLS